MRIVAPFDGLGLRGNGSTPVIADGVIVPKNALLGEDGKGFDIMMGVVLPYFQLMIAAYERWYYANGNKQDRQPCELDNV